MQEFDNKCLFLGASSIAVVGVCFHEYSLQKDRVILLLLFLNSADCLVISSDRETVKSLESAVDRKEIDTAVDSPGNLAIP